ncbi:hypothetical protein B0J14DRAFT_602284 [Halenospora varia]|nr:hypothetical protein B0J14DRAFT_602284 [Halenospora varia]
MGIVVITERGYTVQQVDTGQDLDVDQFVELTFRDGQACLIHGSSTVLYYKPRKVSFPSQSPPARKPLPSQVPQSREIPKLREEPQQRETSIISQPKGELIARALTPPPFTTEITIRLQIDTLVRFSAPYDLSVFHPRINNLQFFSWFGRLTGRGGVKGPSMLKLTLKDAMPVAKVINIESGDEESFGKVRDYILVQFEKAKLFMPRLKEFGVLIVDPGWATVGGKWGS